MTIPEIRLECLKIAGQYKFPHIEHLKYHAEILVDWIFKNQPNSEIDSEVIKKLNSLNSKLDIMGDNTQAALEKLDAILTTVGKVKTETTASLAKIEELKALAEANKDTPAEVVSKIDEVFTAVKAADDLIPDAPAEETQGGEGSGTENRPQ